MNPPKSINFFLFEIFDAGLGPVLDLGIVVVTLTGGMFPPGALVLASADIGLCGGEVKTFSLYLSD